MRELKFRFYSKDAMRLLNVESADFFSGRFEVRYNGRLHILDGLHNLEQFTGLHDKNGKEIYDGDILHNKAGGYAPVIYRCGGFFVELLDCEEFGTMYVPLNEAILLADLVGNVHENHELLEATNGR